MQSIRFSKSMHLFAMPSFVFGAARVLDLGSTFDVYNESLNGHIADQRAFLSDWQQVGMDISDSMEIFEHV